MKKTVLIPLPERDVYQTEIAVPWKLLTDRVVDVIFATVRGTPGRVVVNVNYGSARWPGDAHQFAHQFCALI